MFGKLLFGFLPLCTLDMEPPKVVYLKENCQWTSHKNTMQIQCMLPEVAKNIISVVQKFDTLPNF